MHTLPTPAELATFARAVGWPEFMGKKAGHDIPPHHWSSEEIGNVLFLWKGWRDRIAEADREQLEEEADISKNLERAHSIEEALAELTSSKATLKSYFIASQPRWVSPQQAETAWMNAKCAGAFTRREFERMRREKAARLSNRATAGGRAKAEKSSQAAKQKNQRRRAG